MFLAAWEAFGRAVNPILFAPPSEVTQAFVELTADGRLPRAFLTTVNALTVGYALSVVVGLAVGIVLGRSRRSPLRCCAGSWPSAVCATPWSSRRRPATPDGIGEMTHAGAVEHRCRRLRVAQGTRRQPVEPGEAM